MTHPLQPHLGTSVVTGCSRTWFDSWHEIIKHNFVTWRLSHVHDIWPVRRPLDWSCDVAWQLEIVHCLGVAQFSSEADSLTQYGFYENADLDLLASWPLDMSYLRSAPHQTRNILCFYWTCQISVDNYEGFTWLGYPVILVMFVCNPSGCLDYCFCPWNSCSYPDNKCLCPNGCLLCPSSRCLSPNSCRLCSVVFLP